MAAWIFRIFKTNSIHGVNVKLLKFFGFLERTNDTSLLAALALLVTVFTCQQLGLLFCNSTPLQLFTNMFTSTVGFKCLLRLWNLYRREGEFVAYVRLAEGFQTEIERTGDKNVLAVLRKAVRLSQIITNFNLGLKMFAGYSNAIKSLLTREFLMLIWLPYVDVDVTLAKPPFFDFITVVQGLMYVPLALSIYSIFTNLTVAWLILGITMFKNLCYDLEQLTHEQDEKSKCNGLKKCIRTHKAIVRFCDDFQSLLSTLIFQDFVIFILLCCLELFLLYIADDAVLKMTAFSYAINTFTSLILPYWFAHELMEESVKVANAAYNVDWYNANKDFRTMTLFMIERAQKPIVISYYGLSPMTLETVQKLMKTSYSAFAMMQTMDMK